jgi:transposase
MMSIMKLQDVLKPVSRDQLKSLRRTDLIELLLGEQKLRSQAEAYAKQLEEEKYLIDEKYVLIKNRIFSPSSEKGPKDKNGKDASDPKPKPKGPEDRTRLPSERYPDAKILEQDIEMSPLPQCSCCGHQMSDSGMSDTVEMLSVIPKQIIIKRQIYHKYHCRSCHGSVVTTPTLPRIKPGSSYDDEFIIDVAASKYCDLIPIERFCSIANRQGFKGLPPHSLIELTHYFAAFLLVVYKMIKREVFSAKVLHADETTHRMLEGSETRNWYLWGFSTATASYFECHDTRSGDVAFSLLANSNCQYLMSDVYSGYTKAVKICNKLREQQKLGPPIQNVFCNAHVRRKFRELPGDAGAFFVEKYREIYKNEKELKGCSDEERLLGRQKVVPLFDEMKVKASELLEGVSSKSHQAKAANYLLNNIEGFTRFLQNGSLPIDNNSAERQLRTPVIGRKTWLGTHSEKGAETAAVLFSIFESCKLNGLNPRAYLQQLVKDIHQKKGPYTPREAAIASQGPPTCSPN